MHYEGMRLEIIELFVEARHICGQDRLAWMANAGSRNGFTIVDSTAVLAKQARNRTYPVTDARRAYKAQWERESAYLAVKRRLRAGERPKAGPGRRGRRPELWLRAARELGIDLSAA